MNIQSISVLNFPNLKKNNNNHVRLHKINNLSPLPCDVVSFSGGAKNLKKCAKSISNDLAMQVVKEAKEDAKDLLFVLKKYLKPYVACNEKPNAIICPGEKGIKVRIKNEDSIREKVTERGITTLFGVKNLGDIVGARVVLRDANPKQVDNILSAFAKAHKQGAIHIVEIEKYNPNGGMLHTDTKNAGYGSSKGLKVLEDAASIISRVGPKESGYPAIHVNVKTKNNFKAEIQIMGIDVEELKEIEDLAYKIRCGKGTKLMYKELEPELLEQFAKLEEKGLQESYMNYVRDSYLHAFNLPAQKFNTRKKTQFLDIPYFLPSELDFNNLYQKMDLIKRGNLNMKKTSK